MHTLREDLTYRGVLDAVLDHAEQAPDLPAVKDLERGLTRGELRDAMGRVAAGLRQKGVEPGDRVVLLIKRLLNLGDAKTLAIHPASTTHRQLSDQELVKAGIRPETIRLSIGIEHIDDIIDDIDQALAKATVGHID